MEVPYIFYAIFHHHQSIQPHATGKASVDRRVNAAHFENIWVNHAATQQFNPTTVATNVTALLFTEWTAPRQLKARLRERKVERLGFNLNILLIVFTQKSRAVTFVATV